jgi:outer membrane protein TolC
LLLLAFLLSARTAPVRAQSTPVLDELIAMGLRNNLTVKQDALRLAESQQGLRAARGGFLPSLDLQARYSRAEGGRTIDVPVGDLVNPAYRALEDLGAGAFPTVSNQSIPFLREREQETSFRLSQPIFVPRVWHGVRAQRHQVDARKAALQSEQRRLVRDIQTAYFGFRKAEKRVEILETAHRLTQENRRTNASLYAANKVTQDAVYRAEAEVLAVEQEIEDAKSSRDAARRRLNVLLNRAVDTPIEAPRQSPEALVANRTADVLSAVPTGATGGDRWIRRAQAQRPELSRLDAAAAAATDQAQIARSRFLPEISLAIDAGTQGRSYGFGADQRFVMGSVVLSWTLFNGFQDRARLERARLEAQRLQTQRKAFAQQVELQVQSALDEVRVAQTSFRTAKARVQAARESFRITRRRAEEGRANQVTFIDARSARTEAELNLNVTRYTLLQRLAELEYAAGLFPLSSTPSAATTASVSYE